MHKITANYNALISHTAAGGYATINELNTKDAGRRTGGDSPGGQSGMSGEMGGLDEAPQPYGMASSVAKGKDIGSGKGTGAEALMSYPGGNRSFRVAGVIADRRHGWKGLKEGEVGLHGLKEWGQQFLNSADGMFMTGNLEKKMRFALVENTNGKQQQGGQQGGQSGGGGGGGSGADNGGGQEQQEEDLGQKSLDSSKSEAYIEQTKEMNEYVNKQHIIRRTSNVAFEVNPDDKCYSGGLKKEHKFSKSLTVDGPSPWAFERIG